MSKLSEIDRNVILPIVRTLLSNCKNKASGMSIPQLVASLKHSGYTVNRERVIDIIYEIRTGIRPLALIMANNSFYVVSSLTELDEYLIMLQKRINEVKSIQKALRGERLNLSQFGLF